jgi:hypothetical protein
MFSKFIPRSEILSRSLQQSLHLVSLGGQHSFLLYLPEILIISPWAPFPPKGNFSCKSARIIYHWPAFFQGPSTHIDFVTWLSNYLHKSANSQTNNVSNKSKRCLWSSKEVMGLYFQKIMWCRPTAATQSIFKSPCSEFLEWIERLPSWSLWLF